MSMFVQRRVNDIEARVAELERAFTLLLDKLREHIGVEVEVKFRPLAEVAPRVDGDGKA